MVGVILLPELYGSRSGLWLSGVPGVPVGYLGLTAAAMPCRPVTELLLQAVN